MVLVQRADRVIDKDIFQLIELVGFTVAGLWDIENTNDLLKQRVENTPDEITFFTLRDLQIS